MTIKFEEKKNCVVWQDTIHPRTILYMTYYLLHSTAQYATQDKMLIKNLKKQTN